MKKLQVKILIYIPLIYMLGLGGLCKPLLGQTQKSSGDNVNLSEWSGGIELVSQSDPDLYAFLWFYEFLSRADELLHS